MLGDHPARGHRARLRLLPADALVRTGDVDHADWNYRPVLGRIQRTRFALAEALLPPRRVPRLLELGYGSGVFLTELARNCEELYGIDVHARQRDVEDVLLRFGVTAHLAQAPAERIPFGDAMFDVVVAVSTLEFVGDLDATCREVTRVLKPDGAFVVVTPGRSALVDFGLKVLTGKDARADFGDRREHIVDTLRRWFDEDWHVAYPPVVGTALKLYDAFRLRPRAT